MAENHEPVFVYKNRGRLTPEQIIQRGLRLKYHCEENGYLQDGSLSMSVPMSQSGSELQWIMDYCRSHGISKILVDGLLDIGRTPDEVDRTAQILCASGFQVEVADCGLIYSPQNEAPEQNSGMTMGGMKLTQYLYPQNLKAKANLWLWGLRDFTILCVAILLAAVVLVHSGILLPAAVSLCFGFLTIRAADETTIMDYLRYAVRYFLTTQQYFEWRLTD